MTKKAQNWGFKRYPNIRRQTIAILTHYANFLTQIGKGDRQDGIWDWPCLRDKDGAHSE